MLYQISDLSFWRYKFVPVTNFGLLNENYHLINALLIEYHMTNFKRIRHLFWIIKNLFRYLYLFTPLGHLRPKYLMHSAFKLHNTCFGKNGKVIYLNRDRVIAPQVNLFGYYDPLLVEWISEQLNSTNSKNIFIDIGANQGLVTLQVANKIKSPENCRIICLEPVDIYFNNLQKNCKLISDFLEIKLYQFGLGLVSHKNAMSYRSIRNATATQHRDLSLDPSKKLIADNIEILEVKYFVENILKHSLDESITIKSDTDGSDIAIFNAFSALPVSNIIKCYVLEIILTNLEKKDLDIFILNCNKFENWTLKLPNNEFITSKELITELFSYQSNFRGDLILIK